jgi:hypothetical protein
LVPRVDVQGREARDIKRFATANRHAEVDVERLEVAPQGAGGPDGELTDHLEWRHVHAERVGLGGRKDFAGAVPSRGAVR